MSLTRLISALELLASDEPIGDMLRDAQCGPIAGTAIADALRGATSRALHTFDLYGNGLLDSGIVPILQMISEDSAGSVHSLDLGDNGLSQPSAAALRLLINSSTSPLEDNGDSLHHVPIRDLRLARNALHGAACHTLLSTPPDGAAASSALGLHSLTLSFNPLGAAGGQAIAAALSSERLPQLRSLQLHGCQLGSEGAKSLGLSLRDAVSLTHLDLCDNGLFDEGACAIAAALPTAPHALSELLLSRNAMGDASAHAIATSLVKRPNSCRLRLLTLSHNKMRDASAVALSEALGAHPSKGGNRTLEVLDLRGNKLGASAAIALGDVLVANATLTSLDLGANRRIKADALHAIEELLSHNRAASRRMPWTEAVAPNAAAKELALLSVQRIFTYHGADGGAGGGEGFDGVTNAASEPAGGQKRPPTSDATGVATGAAPESFYGRMAAGTRQVQQPISSLGRRARGSGVGLISAAGAEVAVDSTVRQSQMQAEVTASLRGVQCQLEDASREVAALRRRQAVLEEALVSEGFDSEVS